MDKIKESGRVTFAQAWHDLWAGFIDFKGISTRAGFWWGILIYTVISFLIGAIGGLLGSKVLAYTVAAIVTVPMLAAAARRFRDIGLKEGLIITFVVIYIIFRFLVYIIDPLAYLAGIYNIAMIVLLCLPTGIFKE